jgi:hypothetical protein
VAIAARCAGVAAAAAAAALSVAFKREVSTAPSATDVVSEIGCGKVQSGVWTT